MDKKFKRLLDVMSFITSHPKHYEQGVWHEKGKHCFMGFAEIVAWTRENSFSENVVSKMKYVLRDNGWPNREPEEITCDYFGISWDAHSEINHFEGSIEELETLINKIIANNGQLETE